MNTALLLVDIQNDYFPGGAMELPGSVMAGARARQLVEAFRRSALPIIHVQHISTRPGATFFLPGTGGVEINECVTPIEGEAVIRKHFPNSFRDTPLLAHLREKQIARLVIAGMMTHMCIDTTTRAAADLGFECWLAHDACACKALSFGGVAIPAESVQAAYMASLNGLFAKVLPVEAICADPGTFPVGGR
ncbi:MAG: cysteine hydrolase family protein [Candidatus Brocadiia bacterium]